MAIYHFSVKVIGRACGRSAVATAAYRLASRLHDERLRRDHDFSNKPGVVHSEILPPDNAPERLSEGDRLWNEVEAVEKRKDAQLSREIEFALPREMDEAQGIELARDFVRAEFLSRGMVADLNVHWDIGADGQPKARAHFMLTMREVGAKLAYATLLKYAWADDASFPGQLKLAEDMGAGERSVRTYLRELETAELLEITQRGLGKTNLYRLFLTLRKFARRRT